MKDKKPIIGITMGDPSGIGAEIVVKALSNPDIYKKCIPVVYGDLFPIEDAIRFCQSNLKINVIKNVKDAKCEYGYIDLICFGIVTKGDYEYKKVCIKSGHAAFVYLINAIEDAKKRVIDAITTGPINKESLNLAGHHFAGHTEILAEYTNTKDYSMLLLSNQLRVIHVTTHVPLKDVSNLVKKERVLKVIELANYSAKLLGFEKPRIAVCGLNPHASDNGVFGKEEKEEISPAIHEAIKKGLNVDGPLPSDTVFVKAIGGQYDIVVAMYHDQGHIPLKLSGFKYDYASNKYFSMSGVNCTIGLPIIRTSVDHGTAFGKAGDGKANEGSMVEALNTAIKMTKYFDFYDNDKSI